MQLIVLAKKFYLTLYSLSMYERVRTLKLSHYSCNENPNNFNLTLCPIKMTQIKFTNLIESKFSYRFEGFLLLGFSGTGFAQAAKRLAGSFCAAAATKGDGMDDVAAVEAVVEEEAKGDFLG